MIGDTTNMAQRLQASAAPGQIVIGSKTATALGSEVGLTAFAPVHVKGRLQPVESFALE